MNRIWKLLLCSTLVLSFLLGCASKVEESTSQETQPPITSETQGEAQQIPTPVHSGEIFPDSLSGRIPVIYSHGGGPCDIAGMAYLSKHPNVDFIGWVLTRGEFHPEIAVGNWPIFLFDVLQSSDTAIALGSDERMDPNSHEFPEVWRTLSDDFWGISLPPQATEFETGFGPDLIIELVNNSPDKVTVVGMASMIDIALALQKDPGIIDNISHVVIMGGAFTVPGNLDEGPDPTNNDVAEWNMYIDAQAAKYLFNSGVPLSIVPLDAIQYLVQSEDVDRMNAIADPAVSYVAQMWNQQFEWSGGAGFLIWDTITITAVTNPENFYWTYDGVDVIAEPGDYQGQTIALNNGATHSRYATGADYDAILDQIFETFEEGSRTETDDTVESELIISELAGTWEGFTGDFHITFFLETACKLNEKCGTFEIPEFSLTGDVTFVEIDGDKYIFQATNMSSGLESTNYEYLQILEDGTLKYYTTNQVESSEAILTRR